METSVCRKCRQKVFLGYTLMNEWVHGYGGVYCLDNEGFTATPIARAEPILETQVL